MRSTLPSKLSGPTHTPVPRHMSSCTWMSSRYLLNLNASNNSIQKVFPTKRDQHFLHRADPDQLSSESCQPTSNTPRPDLLSYSTCATWRAVAVSAQAFPLLL